MPRVFLALAILALAWPAHAQQMSLQIKDGRVSLEANAVPVRQILAEWARVGGTKIVGADKITGAPLTLHIVNMPERAPSSSPGSGCDRRPRRQVPPTRDERRGRRRARNPDRRS